MPAAQLKSELNGKFAAAHPDVAPSLTLSKIRSLKAEALRLLTEKHEAEKAAMNVKHAGELADSERRAEESRAKLRSVYSTFCF